MLMRGASLAHAPGTRVLVALVAVFSGILAYLRAYELAPFPYYQYPFRGADGALAYPHLVLVPGPSLKFPWTLVSAALFETSVPEFAAALAVLALAAPRVEALWGWPELLNFAVVVAGVSNVLAVAVAHALYVLVGAPLDTVQYHGTLALQTGLLVAVAQTAPHARAQLGPLTLGARTLVMAYLAASNVLCVLGRPAPFILIQFGWLVAYVYLRIYQRHDAGRGDCSDAFAFETWFPPPAAPAVRALARAAHRGARALHLVPPPEYDLDLDLPPPLLPQQGPRGGTATVH